MSQPQDPQSQDNGQQAESSGPSFEAPVESSSSSTPDAPSGYEAPSGFEPTGDPYGQAPLGAPDQPSYHQPSYGQPDYDQPSYGSAPQGYGQPADAQHAAETADPAAAYGQAPYAPAEPAPYTQPGYGQAPGYGTDSAYGADAGYGAQPGYGMQPAYGSQGYYYGNQPLAEHPQAQTVLILGIVGIFVNVVSFVAWYMGRKAKKEIDAGAPYAWSGSLKIGYILGMVVSILVLVSIAFLILFFLILIPLAMVSS